MKLVRDAIPVLLGEEEIISKLIDGHPVANTGGWVSTPPSTPLVPPPVDRASVCTSPPSLVSVRGGPDYTFSLRLSDLLQCFLQNK